MIERPGRRWGWAAVGIGVVLGVLPFLVALTAFRITAADGGWWPVFYGGAAVAPVVLSVAFALLTRRKTDDKRLAGFAGGFLTGVGVLWLAFWPAVFVMLGHNIETTW